MPASTARERLKAEIASSGRFELVEDKNVANAILKGRAEVRNGGTNSIVID